MSGEYPAELKALKPARNIDSRGVLFKSFRSRNLSSLWKCDRTQSVAVKKDKIKDDNECMTKKSMEGIDLPIGGDTTLILALKRPKLFAKIKFSGPNPYLQ